MRAVTAFGRQFVLPNGIIVLCAVVAFRLALFSPSAQATETAIIVTGAAALALAWRFHLPRMALALLTVGLLMFGVQAAGQAESSVGGCAIALLAFVAPINLAFLLLIEDSNFDIESFGWWAGVITLEALLVYAMSRSEALEVARWLRAPTFDAGPFAFLLSPVAIVGLLALAALFVTAIISRKPADIALFWTAVVVPLAIPQVHRGGESLFFIAAALVLGSGVLESSYAVAYNDELTGLPGRRAYNRYATHLSGTYSIAVVDIDHFKKFNDTYGHDVGDQVLRMVATKLSLVTGSGRAFRLGGEEFAIVFPFSGSNDAVDHLDILREDIELTPFMVRGPDRSARPRDERRHEHDARRTRRETIDTRVTVSIGLADSAAQPDPEDVMLTADRALYEAKGRGRNQVVRSSGSVARQSKARRTKISADQPALNDDRFR